MKSCYKNFSLILFILVYSFGCDVSNNLSEKNNVKSSPIDVLIKQSQLEEKLGNYQELFIAPYKGGYAVIQSPTPKGLDSDRLAFYWVENEQQAYAINEAAINLSPSLPRYYQLPIEVNPAELLAAVKKNDY
jgi:hypothetical protein